MKHAKSFPLPERIAQLPKDERGYPITFTTAIIDGKPDFRVLDPEKQVRCMVARLCAICGQHIEGNVYFIGGPKIAIYGLALDPAMHLECATFSLNVCPHLALRNSQFRTAPVGTTVHEMASDEKVEEFLLVEVGKYNVGYYEGALVSQIVEGISTRHWRYDATGRLREATA